MNHQTTTRRIMAGAALLACLCFTSGCTPKDRVEIQGYVEGEYVYVASPFAGMLEKLAVQRGTQVTERTALYTLESVAERATRDEEEKRLAQAKATLEDAKKGRRPSEMAALEAQLKQSQAAMSLSERELARQERLARTGATSDDDVDRARSARDQNRERVAQLTAEVTTGQLGLRSDQVAAAEAEVRAREAALARAEWELAQKQQNAPKAGLVTDTLYREGEWVAAGKPVIVLLPPQNIKVRAFVPEARIAAVHAGDPAQVTMDGVEEPFTGKVSFISPEAEYTPPVIYSRESRSKLVFMIELTFDPQTAEKLHPGQPVDVRLGH